MRSLLGKPSLQHHLSGYLSRKELRSRCRCHKFSLSVSTSKSVLTITSLLFHPYVPLAPNLVASSATPF